RPLEKWVELLRKAGVPAGIVADIAEAFDSEQVRARHAVREVKHAEIGHYRVLKTPARLHDTEPLGPEGGPVLGQHTREILGRLGGLTEAQINALISSGAAR
ncbi:MAG: CoA transferase, partial [Hyphomicrobiaceae bacterium]